MSSPTAGLVSVQVVNDVHRLVLADPAFYWEGGRDGCYARAVLLVERMEREGIPRGAIGKLLVVHKEAPMMGWDVLTRLAGRQTWSQHVVATVETVPGLYVIDPTLCDLAEPEGQWDAKGKAMTTETFIILRDLTEVPEGLRVLDCAGQTSLLRRDNDRYARIEELLRNAYETSVPWPVRIARSSDGVIINARPAWGGRIIYIEDTVGADRAVVCFLLENEPKVVKHDDPNFERLLEILMDAAGTKRDVFYSLEPGTNILADVCLADSVASQSEKPCPRGG